MMIIPETHRAF